MRKVEHMKGESVAQLAVFEGQAAREAAGLKEFTDVGRLELPFKIGGSGQESGRTDPFFRIISKTRGATETLNYEFIILN